MIGHSKQMAKRGLETYCLYMRETLQEKGLKEKFKSGDEEKIENVVQATLDWLRQLDKNKLAEEGECEAKQRELDGVVNPIMAEVYQAAGGPGGSGAKGNSTDQDLEPLRQRRRGGRLDYIVVENDGEDYIEDDSAIQAFVDSFGLASSESAVQMVASPGTSPFGVWL